MGRPLPRPPVVPRLVFFVGMIVCANASSRSAAAAAAARAPLRRGRRMGHPASAFVVPPSALGPPRLARPHPVRKPPDGQCKTREVIRRRPNLEDCIRRGRNLTRPFSSSSGGGNDEAGDGAPPQSSSAAATRTTVADGGADAPVEELNFDLRVDLLESEYTGVIYRDDVPCAALLRRAYDAAFDDPREPPSDETNPRFSWDPWFVRCSDGRRRKKGDGDPAGGGGEVDDVDAVRMIPGEREATDRQTQYSLKRAMCHDLFGRRPRGGDDADDADADDAPLLSALLDDLTALGRSIGCAGITPPWISMYTSGDSQNFHTDPTHGPMAWTLSLTHDADYTVAFTGGETLLLKPDVLEHWRDYDYGAGGRELGGLCRVLPPTFGRCVAFDPRVPHGVNPVVGTTDPRRCRVMIHGWFARPEPTWFGDFLAAAADADDGDGRGDCVRALDDALGPLLDQDGPLGGGGDVGRVVGFLAVRLDVAPDGTPVGAPQAVCDTLVADPADFGGVVGVDESGNDVVEDAAADVRLAVREALAGASFPTTGGGGGVVVPFEFV